MDVRKLVIILLVIPISFSQINVTKIAPEKVSLNDVISITISIKNQEDTIKNLTVYEYPGDVIPIEPKKFIIPNTSGCKICMSPPYFMWNIIVKNSETRNITYKIKPKSIGELIIPPTVVYDIDGNTFYSNEITIKIKCNNNGVCEPSLGENYFNCEDCPSGSKDGVCDLIDDGKCDPDCEPGYDDCICNGDGVCEQWENKTCSDCKEKNNPRLIIIIAGIALIIIFVSFLTYKIIKYKKRKRHFEADRKWMKFCGREDRASSWY